MGNIELCAWGVSKDIDAPNFESCKSCGKTRNDAINIKCQACLFENSDGSYTGNYQNLTKEKKEELTGART